MSVGLRIFNNDGISQISDIARNLVLVGKGTDSDTAPNYYGKNFEFVYDGPVIFAASAPSGATAIVTGKAGSTYKFMVLFDVPWETLTWYAFSYAENVQSTMGLRVFNGTGSLIYDSTQKPLRIAHYSRILTPGFPPFPSKVSDISEKPPPPPDIYIPQQRSNRTYASLGIHMIPYRKHAKIRYQGQWLLGWALFYYLPVAYADGIRLKAWDNALFAVQNSPWPPGTMPYGGTSLYDDYQTSFIIDVTDY